MNERIVDRIRENGTSWKNLRKKRVQIIGSTLRHRIAERYSRGRNRKEKVKKEIEVRIFSPDNDGYEVWDFQRSERVGIEASVVSSSLRSEYSMKFVTYFKLVFIVLADG